MLCTIRHRPMMLIRGKRSTICPTAPTPCAQWCNPEADKPRIVMIGNNLKKDVAGANRFGLTSIWMDWSPRYFHEFEEEDWKPDYTVKHPSELIPLLEQLEKKLEEAGTN